MMPTWPPWCGGRCAIRCIAVWVTGSTALANLYRDGNDAMAGTPTMNANSASFRASRHQLERHAASACGIEAPNGGAYRFC
jgi:hypothetical protein